MTKKVEMSFWQTMGHGETGDPRKNPIILLNSDVLREKIIYGKRQSSNCWLGLVWKAC